jgi:hypothetical protein
MNFEKLDKLPDSALNDITAKQPAQHSPGVPFSPVSEVGTDELNNAAEHTQTHILDDNTATSEGAPGAPGFGSPTSAPIKLGGVMGGRFVTDIMDALTPAIMVYVAGFAGYNVSKKELQLSEKEKALIAPAMQDYLNSINVNFNNPLYNLLFVVGGVYGAKLIEVMPKAEKIPKNKKSIAPVVPLTKQQEIKSEVAQVAEKMKVKQSREENTRIMLKEISGLHWKAAVSYIQSKRRKGLIDAQNWYNKHKQQA